MRDYNETTDFTYDINWMKEKAFIQVTFLFNKTIERTTMELTLNNPEYIMSRSGKKIETEKIHYQFMGYRQDSETVVKTVETLGSVGGRGVRAMLIASAGALMVSTIFTNSLSFLSKLIQVIEFTSMLGLFNFEYDPLLSSFLSQLAKMTEFDVISFPLNKLVSNIENSEASQWKGKLSENHMKPYYLQDFGYAGVIMAVSEKILMEELKLEFD